MAIHQGEQIEELCAVTGGVGGSEATHAGITAMRILAFSGTKPARNGTMSLAVPQARRARQAAAGR
jgi:hypothetical protein